MFLIVSLLFSGWKTVKIGVVLWGTQQSEELRETFSAFSVNDNGRKKWATFFSSRSHEGYQSFYSHNSGTFIHLQIICHHWFRWNWFDFHLNGSFPFKQSRFNKFSWFYVKLFWAVVAIHPTRENNGHCFTFPEVSIWLLVHKTRWNVCDAGVRSKWAEMELSRWAWRVMEKSKSQLHPTHDANVCNDIKVFSLSLVHLIPNKCESTL